MRRGDKKYLRALLITLGGIAALIIILLTGFTLWLTPHRLSQLIDREASRYLDAELQVSDVRFTIWSSFPRLAVSTDSILVISHSLDSISPDIRSRLPEDADSLASLSGFSGEINLIDLISGRYVLKNVRFGKLDLNLVAYNDSVNNYNIVHQSVKGPDRVPYLTADSLSLSQPAALRYFSYSTNTYADLKLEKLLLHRTDRDPVFARDHHDSYNFMMEGTVSATAQEIPFLTGFPFLFDGKVTLGFDPFSVKLSDYSIDLGDIKGKLSMSMGIGDNPALNHFDYRISTLNLMTLINYLPEELRPDIAGLSASLPIEASARLTSPWSLSSENLPSIAIQFNIPQGGMSYTLANSSYTSSGNNVPEITAFHSSLGGTFLFNGEDPVASTILINPFSFSSDGVTLNISGVKYQLNSPELKVGVDCTADIRKAIASVGQYFPALSHHLSRITGTLTANNQLNIQLGDISDNYIPHSISGIAISGEGEINDLNAVIGAENTSLRAKNITFTYSTEADTTGNFSNNHLSVTGRHIATVSPDMNVDLSSFSTGITFSQNNRPRPFGKGLTIHPLPQDIPHSSQYIITKTPPAVGNLITNFDYNASLDLKNLNFRGKGKHAQGEVRTLKLAITPDILSIDNLDMSMLSTPAKMKGRITGLADFLRDSVNPRPLDMDINVDMGIVNINQLAHTFLSSPKRDLSQKTTHNSEASDSVAYLVPENLSARIRANAKETVYMNLHLYDLSTRLNIQDGIANLDTLDISTDFGHGALSFLYDTRSLQNMGFKANLGLDNINIVNFFKNFHTLLMMMPEMENLSGNLSLNASMGGAIFPDMVLNMPSLYASIGIKGRELVVKQSHFIRHITKMMLITNDNPLHIEDMNVSAGIHGNLLQLEPFYFNFDSYSIRMLGINNFNDRLYYHIGVEKNPLHIPFAINVEGMFHNPKIRFGRTVYDYKKGLEISESVEEQNNINLVGILKTFAGEFIRKAAQAAEDPNLSL